VCVCDWVILWLSEGALDSDKENLMQLF